MDEQQNQDQPNQVPVPEQPQPVAQPATPQQPSGQPVSNTPVPQAQQPVPTQSPAQPSSTTLAEVPKSKKGLYAIVGAIVAVLIVVVIVLYFVVFSAAAQANKASVAFMDAASQGDGDKLALLTNDTSEDGKKFMNNVADALEGQYKLDEKTLEEGKWYFLYSLTGADKKYARTIVEQIDGEWTVISIVFSNSELKLVPGGGVVEEDGS